MRTSAAPLVFAVTVQAVLAASAATPAAPAATAAARPAVPFIEDDYPRALAEARARKLPIFVEAWAPW